ACIFLFTSPIWSSWRLEAPLPQYLFAIVPMASGIAMGMRAQIKFARFAILGILALSLLLCLNPSSIYGEGEPYLVGLGVAALVIEYGDRLVPETFNIGWLSKCMFGVFLT